MKYRTILNGEVIEKETYKEVCDIIANSGLMSMHPIVKDEENKPIFYGIGARFL